MHDTAQRSFRLWPVLVAAALVVSACSSSSDSSSALTTATTPTATSSTDTFSGTITQGGTAIHPFTVKTSGYSVLAGYTSLSPASVTALGMGIGTWDGSTCSLNVSQNDTSRAGNTALSGTAYSGNFCIRVYDGGNITDNTVTVSYTLQVQHY
jgi:hypothetical protein